MQRRPFTDQWPAARSCRFRLPAVRRLPGKGSEGARSGCSRPAKYIGIFESMKTLTGVRLRSRRASARCPRRRVERTETLKGLTNVARVRRGWLSLDGDADLLAVLHIRQWLSQTKRVRAGIIISDDDSAHGGMNCISHRNRFALAAMRAPAAGRRRASRRARRRSMRIGRPSRAARRY